MDAEEAQRERWFLFAHLAGVMGGSGPGAHEALESAERERAVGGALQRLGARERWMLQLRYGFQGRPMSYRAIGVRFSRSATRVRAIVTRAEAKLRVLLQEVA